MTKPKQIRGLLDYIGLKPGEEFEWEPASESYVPGMGLGASEDAIRWAYRGIVEERSERLLETISSLARPAKKKGAPQKTPEFRSDNLRTFYLWYIIRDLPLSFRCEITNRRAIELAAGNPVIDKTKLLFPDNYEVATIEQSVSRGKSFWRIDDCWNSKRCEQFYIKYLPKN
jgi:hypothetical protein